MVAVGHVGRRRLVVGGGRSRCSLLPSSSKSPESHVRSCRATLESSTGSGPTRGGPPYPSRIEWRQRRPVNRLRVDTGRSLHSDATRMRREGGRDQNLLYGAPREYVHGILKAASLRFIRVYTRGSSDPYTPPALHRD